MENKNLETFVVEINGKNVNVETKRFLTLTEMIQFVNNIVLTVVDTDNHCMPELLDFAIRQSTITAYTNYELPDDINEAYDLLYRTDLYDYIIGKSLFCKDDDRSQHQYDAAIEAAKQKIAFYSNLAARKSKLDDVLDLAVSALAKMNANFADADPVALIEVLKNVQGIDAASLVKAMTAKKSDVA